MGIAFNGDALGTATGMIRNLFAVPTSISIWAYKVSVGSTVSGYFSNLVDFTGTDGASFNSNNSTGGHTPSVVMGGGSFRIYGTAKPQDQWNHIAFVLNASDDVPIYVNGSLDVTADNPDTYVYAAREFFAGRVAPQIGLGSANSIAELSIYSRFLSGADISALASGDSPMGLSGGDPLAYWRFQDITDLTDHTGNYPLSAMNPNWVNSGVGHPPVNDPPIGPVGADRKLINRENLMELGLIA